MITWPDQIELVNSNICRGLLNLNENMYCDNGEGNEVNTRVIPLSNANSGSTSAHAAGTTVQFEMGTLVNPISLKETASFTIYTQAR